jgi:hypothetical protein
MDNNFMDLQNTTTLATKHGTSLSNLVAYAHTDTLCCMNMVVIPYVIIRVAAVALGEARRQMRWVRT